MGKRSESSKGRSSRPLENKLTQKREIKWRKRTHILTVMIHALTNGDFLSRIISPILP